MKYTKFKLFTWLRKSDELSATMQGRRKVWKSGGARNNVWAQPAPPTWYKVMWSAKIWECHGTPGDDRPAMYITSEMVPVLRVWTMQENHKYEYWLHKVESVWDLNFRWDIQSWVQFFPLIKNACRNWFIIAKF